MLGGKSAWWKAGWREMLGEKMLGGKKKEKSLALHYAKHVHRPHPDPEPKGAPWNFISLCKTCTQSTPRPQAQGSQMGLQNMCAHHAQTPNQMEPHGISFGEKMLGKKWSEEKCLVEKMRGGKMMGTKMLGAKNLGGKMLGGKIMEENAWMKNARWKNARRKMV